MSTVKDEGVYVEGEAGLEGPKALKDDGLREGELSKEEVGVDG